MSVTTLPPTGRGARSSPEFERPEEVGWDGLGPEFFRTWGRPGGEVMPEHLTVYGPSGSGKTYFVTYVLTERANLRGTNAVVIATKKADETLTSAGWPVVDEWPPDYGQDQVIYWSRGGLSDEQQAAQKTRVARVANQLWTPGSNRIVAWDELPYVCDDLGLRRMVGTYYREGRGLGITNVSALQRPAGVTRSAHSEPGWSVAFRPKDEDDAKRVAETFGSRRVYVPILMSLDRERRQFLIKREFTQQTYISSLPPRRPVLIRREPGR